MSENCLNDSSGLDCLIRCRLLTTAQGHAAMIERHGVISAGGCEAARARGFKECEGCPKEVL